MAENHGFQEFYARAMLFGTDKDLRLVAVVEILKLNKVDEEIDYNNYHINAQNNNPATLIKRYWIAEAIKKSS